MEPADLKEKST
jgi:hypothetical protein